MSTLVPSLRRDAHVMSLVGLAHASSHFFHLVLPPLFPILKQEFDVSYAQLGLLPGLFFAASGVMQIISGFLVDQFGARRVLLAGLVLLSISMLLCGLVSEFWMLIPLAVVGGIGNSVFHPADLAILTDKVSRPRLGRAYGIHALSGNLGWAGAPMFIMTVVQFSDWRTALVLAGCVTTAYSQADPDSASSLPFAREVFYRVSDAYYTELPQCVTVMPAVGVKNPKISAMVEGTAPAISASGWAGHRSGRAPPPGVQIDGRPQKHLRPQPLPRRHKLQALRCSVGEVHR